MLLKINDENILPFVFLIMSIKLVNMKMDHKFPLYKY